MEYFEEEEFYAKWPVLLSVKEKVRAAVDVVYGVYKPNKIMVCGNGGSCADSQHIVGELMKEFRQKRQADSEFCTAYSEKYSDGFEKMIQGAIPALSLTGEGALISAMVNDVGAQYIYAQQVYGLGYKGDVLIGLSTSGNSVPVRLAFQTARALGITTIGFTGRGGGALAGLTDILINVPEDETYKIQELHLPLYHYICAAAEYRRFSK